MHLRNLPKQFITYRNAKHKSEQMEIRSLAQNTKSQDFTEALGFHLKKIKKQVELLHARLVIHRHTRKHLGLNHHALVFCELKL